MISIIIINYNRKDLLKNCLNAVRMQSFKDIEIILVDNGSSDGSSDMVRTDYPEAKLIENKENLFFCKANNQGIEAAKGDFILCLNSDCVLDRDYLKEAIISFSMDGKIGMVSGKILRMDKKTIDSTGLFLARNRKPLERGYGKLDEDQYKKSEYVFGVSGACMLAKRVMLEDIKDENGYFDETFEIYYEDLDLCWRAKKKGWKAYYNPKAIAYHERGATAVVENINCFGLRPNNDMLFKYLSDDLKKRYVRNRYKCIKKNDSMPDILLNLPFVLWYEIKLWLYLLYSRPGLVLELKIRS
ncbi:MAG: glycosyltransferase family 2 protein [Candidatus Omnitrophica bacterium]|nr:glycosyltransferase family 2 protein [Candidatus Omnitrophota bacterium]